MSMDGARGAPSRPQVLGDETKHYWLIQRMARATGVDLVEATNAGVLKQEEWAEIVTRCRSCQWSEGCQRWIGAPVDEERPFPEPCINRNRLAALKTELEAAQRED